jgi:pimeloyl-ACP methyl ester carboxylesterase
VRLVALNRPGYGGSTTSDVPSLLATGRDTAAVAEHLGLDDYCVMGLSGGGPFAAATALADPDRVHGLAVVGAVGPWRELDDAGWDVEDREAVALLDVGDVGGAWSAMRRLVDRELDTWRALDDEALVDHVLAEPNSAPSPLVSMAEYRALWVLNMAVVMDSPDGYVFDLLSWGGRWDIDVTQVVAPTLAWDADPPGGRAGTWYAERIAGSELVLFPGESHQNICDGHWPEVLDGLMRVSA